MRRLQERGALAALIAAGTRRRWGLLAAVGIAVLAADQLTKWWAIRTLQEHPVDLGPVRLAVTRNTAGAFGLGAGFVPFLAVAAVVLVAVLATTGKALSRGPAAVAVGLVLGGALGNLGDRLFRGPGGLRGAVVDFVDLRWWPVFNLADVAITGGCLLLVLAGWSQRDG